MCVQGKQGVLGLKQRALQTKTILMNLYSYMIEKSIYKDTLINNHFNLPIKIFLPQGYKT